MGAVDTFVACYLIGAMVIFGVLSILAYNKKKRNGELEEEE